MAAPAKRILCEVIATMPADPAGPPGQTAARHAWAGTVVYEPGAEMGPREQRTYELVLLHRGALAIEVDGRQLHLRPGDVALLRPGQRALFRFARHAETHHSWLHDSRPRLPAAVLAALDGVPLTLPFSLPISAALSRLMDAALALHEGPAAPGEALGALVTAALTLYVDEARALGLASLPDAPPREHPAVAAARNVVRRRLAERITLADLADAAHVAPPYLIRLFRQELRTTPMRYLWGERARVGVHLLEHTGLPVAEVALRVGCQTPKHFSRLVCTAAGRSPREVRRRSWERKHASEQQDETQQDERGHGGVDGRL